jgi:hypothetical protein
MGDSKRGGASANAFFDAQVRLFAAIRLLRRRQAEMLRGYEASLSGRKAAALRKQLGRDH